MRIVGPNAASVAASAAPARRAGGGTFSVSERETPRRRPPTWASARIGGIDALMALQGVDDPTERRRRAVKRGRGALDALDDLKLGVLSGQLDTVGTVAVAGARGRPRRAKPATPGSITSWPRSAFASRSRSPNSTTGRRRIQPRRRPPVRRPGANRR